MSGEMRAEPRVSKSRKAPVAGSAFAAWGDAVRRMSPARRIRMIREGVEVNHLVSAGEYYGIPQAKLSGLIGVSEATVSRKIKAGGKLSPQESERLARIAAVEAEAGGVFGSQDLAKRWMLERNLVLGEAPLTLLDTDAGSDEVRKVLAAIAYGATA